MSDVVSLSSARKAAAPKMRIGLLRLTDGAPVIAAHEFGFFADEGLEAELMVEPSWANVADKLAFGFFDAAVIVPPLAFAVQLGVRGTPQPILIPYTISAGVNTVTLNFPLAQETKERANRDGVSTVEALAACLRGRSTTLGVVHAYSTTISFCAIGSPRRGSWPDATSNSPSYPRRARWRRSPRGRLRGSARGRPGARSRGVLG